MRKLKRTIVLFLSLLIILDTVTNQTAFAQGGKEKVTEQHFIIRDESFVTPMTDEELTVIRRYDLEWEDSCFQNPITPKEILEGSEVIKDYYSGDMHIVSYVPEKLSDKLIDCCKITSVDTLDGVLYIDYITNSGDRVILCYDEKGIVSRSVSDEANDRLYCESRDESVCYHNFWKGNSIEITDEYLSYIYTCIEENRIEELLNCDDLIIEQNEGNIIIYPNTPLSNLPRLKNNEEHINAITTGWPPYSNKQIASGTRYCSQIDHNVSVRVLETRNSYVRKSADYRTFVIGALLTSVSYFLGVTVSVTQIILSGLSILFSATALGESAYLARTAAYTYYGARRGDVYDYIETNTYIPYASYSGNGEFHGGYNPSGSFQWVYYLISSAFTVPTSSIMDEAAAAYDQWAFAYLLNHPYGPD